MIEDDDFVRYAALVEKNTRFPMGIAFDGVGYHGSPLFISLAKERYGPQAVRDEILRLNLDPDCLNALHVAALSLAGVLPSNAFELD